MSWFDVRHVALSVESEIKRVKYTDLLSFDKKNRVF